MRCPRRFLRAPAALSFALVLTACVSAGSVATPAPQSPVPTQRPTTATPTPSKDPPSPHPDQQPVPTPWGRALDRLIGPRQVSVAVRVGTTLVYAHLAGTRRAPASNEKLLLSMTALSELGPDYRIRTDAAVESGVLKDGVVHGDLWIVGHGDPEFDGGSASALAAKIRAAGIRRITGSILGDTTGFLRDREAPGWHPLALDNVGLPTALSFNHNVGPSGFVMIPELDAARAVTASLRHGNVKVGGRARAAKAPGSLHPVAAIQSAPLADILHRQNITSDNTDAETLCKLLGTKFGGQGSIAAGATVIHAWLHDRGIEARVMDASGLSYKDRISPLDLTKLLTSALRKSWGGLLRASLPSPGEGTLSSRLAGVAVRAKTGTLTQGISALSGYLRLRSGRTATFSILSEALGKDDAIRIEDTIVRTLAARL